MSVYNYFTNSDFCNIVRDNLWKIPHDIKGVIAIPRSGLFPGTLIAEYLNVTLTTVDLFCDGILLCGGQANQEKNIVYGKYLVIDDSFSSGRSFKLAKEKLGNLDGAENYEFVYCSVISEEDKKSDFGIDIVLHDFPIKRIFELNLLRNINLDNSIIDLDGFLCKDPEWGLDLDEPKYIEFIKTAKPYFIPTTCVRGIVTSRLEKYRDITEQWLNENGVKYDGLRMLPCNSIEEKQNYYTSWEYKGYIYKNTQDTFCFIESSDYEAQKIAQLSGKCVYCVETNKFY